MWRSSNLNSTTFFKHFQQIRNSSNVLSALLSKTNSWKNPCSMADFLCTARSRLPPESAYKLFAQIQLPITTKLQLLNVQHNFCSVVCYTVLICILIMLTLANNILSYPFNWHKPVYCIPSDKINIYQATFAFAFEFGEFWKLKFAFGGEGKGVE